MCPYVVGKIGSAASAKRFLLAMKAGGLRSRRVLLPNQRVLLAVYKLCLDSFTPRRSTLPADYNVGTVRNARWLFLVQGVSDTCRCFLVLLSSWSENPRLPVGVRKNAVSKMGSIFAEECCLGRSGCNVIEIGFSWMSKRRSIFSPLASPVSQFRASSTFLTLCVPFYFSVGFGFQEVAEDGRR